MTSDHVTSGKEGRRGTGSIPRVREDTVRRNTQWTTRFSFLVVSTVLQNRIQRLFSLHSLSPFGYRPFNGKRTQKLKKGPLVLWVQDKVGDLSFRTCSEFKATRDQKRKQLERNGERNLTTYLCLSITLFSSKLSKDSICRGII